MTYRRPLALAVLVSMLAGCSTTFGQWARAVPNDAATPEVKAADNGLLNEVEQAHFRYFTAQSEPSTGLTRDRSQAASPASIAAVGFSLTAYPVGVRRGWVTRSEAAAYTLRVLRTFSAASLGPEPEGRTGHKGLFYHFIARDTAKRVWTCELSTIDTALLMAGVLFAQSYYDGTDAAEQEIRERAETLYRGVDWAWAMDGHDRVSLGWNPEKGFLPYHWGGYNEGMILMLLGLGSPTHPLPTTAWAAYHRGEKAVGQGDRRHMSFGPMFGHQYSHAWVDFRGIKDNIAQANGFDWFENSRRATLAQHDHAVKNTEGWKGYSALDWGLTACDGPGEIVKTVEGKSRQFFGYMARGDNGEPDDGTIAPTAAVASLPFAPELVMPTLRHWRKNRPEIWGPFGFQDAFNPTFDTTKPSGWVGPDTLGIDQGPIVLMIENHRSGFVWEVMRKNAHLRRGLAKAGFRGGWLGNQPGERAGS